MVDTRNHRRYFQRRCALTGETHAQAVECVRAGGADIPLIPDAASVAQAGFEARVLLRLGKSMLSGVPTGEPADSAVDRGPFGITAGLPTRATLTLVPSWHPATFAELVLRLVTFHNQKSGDAMGVAGLRLMFTQDHTILLDTVHGGRITLSGVREHDWTRVINEQLAALGSSWQALTRPDDPFVSTDTDSGLLLNLDGKRNQVTGRLLSAILRRPRLFHTTDTLNFVDLWDSSTHDSTRIEVEWSGELPHSRVIDRVTDPLFGLPLRFDRDEFYDCVCDACLYLPTSCLFSTSTAIPTPWYTCVAAASMTTSAIATVCVIRKHRPSDDRRTSMVVDVCAGHDADHHASAWSAVALRPRGRNRQALRR